MNRKFCTVISLLLALCVLMTAAGCKKKNQSGVSSTDAVTSEETGSSETTAPEPEPEQTDSIDAVAEPVPEDSFGSEEPMGLGIYSSAELTLLNASAPVQNDFLGFNAVYHAFTYRSDQMDRVNTERSAKAELDAVQKSGIHIARTYFDYAMAWDVHARDWDYESDDMQAFYRWCLELKQRGIEVHLSYWSAFSQLYDQYLSYDATSNVYKEGSKPSAFYVEGDEQKTLGRFAAFIDSLFQQLRAKGCTNVTYLSLSTEPGFVYRKSDTMTAEQVAELYATEFLKYSNAVSNQLKKSGLRQNITIVGPNEGASTTPEGYMTKAVYQMDTQNAVDLYSSHSYYHGDILSDGYLYWDNDIKGKLNGFGGGKDRFIYDEYGLIGPTKEQSIQWRGTNAYFGTQLVLQQIATLNNGLRGSYIWTLADQQWPNSITTNNDAFTDGVHYHGILPNYQVSNIPHPGFYAFQLMANYVGVSGSKIYGCDTSVADGLGVYATMSVLPDGNISIAVVNTNLTAASVKINLEKAIGRTMYRHEYDPNAVYPTADAKLIPASAKLENCSDRFYDVVPALGVTVYTTIK